MGVIIVSENASITGQYDSKNMTIDSVPLRALRVAIAVAQRGSFAAAGRHLNLPRAAISRIVGQLEDRTGTRLFRRNTRRVVPTEAGDLLIDAARRALGEIDAALEPTRTSGTDLTGVVRLSVSHAFGRHIVLPSIGRFRGRHPGVHVEALLEDKLDDMLEESIDFTIRLGPVPESDLIVRRLGAIRSGLFAAPSFLHGLGYPVDRMILDRLPAVGFRIPGTGTLMSWPVAVDGSVLQSVAPRSVVSSGSIEAVADFTRDGHGAALLPHYLAASDVAAQRLMAVLPDAISMTTDVHLCLRERRFMPRRVRAVVDHLVHEIAGALRTLDGAP